MSDNLNKIDLNLLCLALLHPNPTVVIEKMEGPLFIKLQAINSIQTLPKTRDAMLSIHMMGSEKPILLSPVESRTFMEKVGLIADQIQQQIQAQQLKAEMANKAALAEAAKNLKIIGA